MKELTKVSHLKFLFDQIKSKFFRTIKIWVVTIAHWRTPHRWLKRLSPSSNDYLEMIELLCDFVTWNYQIKCVGKVRWWCLFSVLAMKHNFPDMARHGDTLPHSRLSEIIVQSNCQLSSEIIIISHSCHSSFIPYFLNLINPDK